VRSSYSTAIVLASLALISFLGWAASRAPAPAAPKDVAATAKPPAPPPPPCLAGQLGLGYFAGRPAGGHDAGIIAIWDRSAAPCSLTSPVMLAGLGKSGKVATPTLEYQVARPQALAARGRKPGKDILVSGSERAVPLMVAAEFRLDPARGYRRCTRQVEPASWRLTFATGGVLTVPNADPHGTPGSRVLPADHGLLTCHGVLDVPAPVRIAPAG